ncbi:FHIPEP family type III secretion protein [Escherichia coli]|nr:FHIPEP family type III secretion protein [Escherichia coli]
MSNLAAMLRLPANLKSTQWQILAGPILILLILSMMVLPLPAFILDLLFTFNIALSIMVLLVAMFTQRTLEFAAFPTILLFTTLLRLALNVASTRIILMEALSRQEMLGAPPVLLVNHALRPLLSRFLRRSLPQLVVLSNLELSDNRHIRMTAIIGGK